MEHFNFLFTGIGGTEMILSINRVVVGVAFVITGFHKCFVPHRHAVFVKTLGECGVPFLPGSAWLVCGVELLGGLALVIGLLSPLAALGLFVIAGVAVATNGIYRIPSDDPEDAGDYVFYFLYLPELLWIVMLLTTICAGPGILSLDYAIIHQVPSDVWLLLLGLLPILAFGGLIIWAANKKISTQHRLKVWFRFVRYHFDTSDG